MDVLTEMIRNLFRTRPESEPEKPEGQRAHENILARGHESQPGWQKFRVDTCREMQRVLKGCSAEHSAYCLWHTEIPLRPWSQVSCTTCEMEFWKEVWRTRDHAAANAPDCPPIPCWLDDLKIEEDESSKRELPKRKTPGRGYPRTEQPWRQAEHPWTRPESPQTPPPKKEFPKREFPRRPFPKREIPKRGSPRNPPPMREFPRTTPKREPPKVEVPKSEAPESETPTADIPMSEAPRVNRNTSSPYATLHVGREAYLKDHINNPFPGRRVLGLRACKSMNCFIAESLRCCHHDVARVLRSSGEYSRNWLLKERTFWHPDKFVGRGEGQLMAQDMFKMIQHLIELEPQEMV